MGMFDHVEVRVPLPDGWEPGLGRLQSKDFDCTMTTVLITAEGRLQIEDFEYEEVPRAERAYPDAKDGWRSIVGSLRPVNRRWRDLNHHGLFNFYADDAEHNWHEYTAKFTDGLLVSIEGGIASPADRGAVDETGHGTVLHRATEDALPTQHHSGEG